MSAADGLDELTDRLYALPPTDFVAARDDAVKAARTAGDRPRAAAIAKLRRPTVAAWLVNLVALRRADLLEALLDLGAEMRSAQHERRGPALRELATRRRAAVGALISEACDLAVAEGATRSGLPVAEVETTLIAALADDGLADVVRAGRLLKSGHYDGFGEPSRPHLQVLEGGADADADPVGSTEVARSAERVSRRGDIGTHKPGSRTEKAGSHPEKAGSRAENRAVPATAEIDVAADRTVSRLSQRPGADESRRRLDEATTALADAEAAYEAAVSAVETRSREVTDIEERLTQLRRERVAAHAALLDAQNAQDSMDAERHAARRRFGAAERAAKRT